MILPSRSPAGDQVEQVELLSWEVKQGSMTLYIT